MEKTTFKCNVGLLAILVIVNAIALIGINMYSNSLLEAQSEASLVKEKLNKLSADITEARWLAASWVLINHEPKTPEKIRLSQFVKTDLIAEYTAISEHTADWDDVFVNTMEEVKVKINEFNEIANTIMTKLATFGDYDDQMNHLEMEVYVSGDKSDVSIIQSSLLDNFDTLTNISNDKIQSSTSTISTLNYIGQFITLILSSLIVFFLLKARQE